MPSINPVGLGPDLGFSFFVNFLGLGEETRAGGGLLGIGGGGVTSSAMSGVASGGAVGSGFCIEPDCSEFTRGTRETFGNSKTGVLDPDWAVLVPGVSVRIPVQGLVGGLVGGLRVPGDAGTGDVVTGCCTCSAGEEPKFDGG